jgi:glycosyltransferase involved in cell wall biosynthesis
MSRKSTLPDGSQNSVCVVTQGVDASRFLQEAHINMIALAERFALDGRNVTLFWVGAFQEEKGEIQKWMAYYRDHYGMRLDCFEHPDQMIWKDSTSAYLSFGVYSYLKRNQFSEVYVPLDDGLAYYSLLAKETAVYLTSSTINVVAHSPIQWLSEVDRFFYWTVEQLRTEFMEKYCASQADRLICTSTGLHEWMRRKNWELAKLCDTLPALSPVEWSLDPEYGELPSSKPRRELVLIASPQFRDGMTLFCDAIDKLDELIGEELSISVVGHFGKILGEHTGGMILRRGRNWRFRIRFLHKVKHRDGIQYAKQSAAIVVIPSFGNAGGYAVSECIRLGVPFVATKVEGNAEQVSARNTGAQLVEPSAADIAKAISERLKSSGITTVNWKQKQPFELWKASARGHSKAKSVARKSASKGQAHPLVSIVMTHHDRPQYFLQALASVRDQDYPNFEVIMVDDGSKRPESHAMLAGLEAEVKRRRWKLIRTENRYVGAARNTGVRASRGKFIVFVDDDNALFPHAVSTFVSAISHSKSDVCTAMSTSFYGDHVPGSGRFNRSGWIPLGPSPDVNMIEQVFGDTMSIYRRTVFDKVGFQFEKFGYMVEDYEFFVRIMLGGLKIRVIPEPLFWYRVSTQGRYRSSHWYDNQIPILDAYSKANFKGMDSLYKLVLGQNIKEYSKQSFRQNLTYSPSDQHYLELSDLEPNSNDAIVLLAKIAGEESRPDTAIGLLSSRAGDIFQKESSRILNEVVPSLVAVREVWAVPFSKKILGVNDLLLMQTISEDWEKFQPMSYVEEPDQFFLECRGRAISLAVLPAAVPSSTMTVNCKISLAQLRAQGAEFLALLCPMHDDPMAAVKAIGVGGADKCSGWIGLEAPGGSSSLEVRLPVPLTTPMNLVLALRSRDERAESVLGCFESLTINMSLEQLAMQRPRLGAPPHRRRARVWTNSERKSTRLVTNYASKLPLLLFPKEVDGGLFLRPSTQGPVIAAIDGGFPAFAQELRAQVEIAHDEASSFEFAVALTPPDADLAWRTAGPKNAMAFSGWIRVDDKFKLHDITLKLVEKMAMPLTIGLGIRLPRGSSSVPANAFWRKLSFSWEE